ncbi:extracellular matrix glycoprotein pherophorin-V34 [Volvox carteri f. nagariensis]|uniref:Extracellular matrix glycoprotein pherophorin-V34 n=1 Tax=Volvox carteri f. nagariensis TaxID=3068 RepID=D8UFE6_VOLCA|nr:extracellular matrix glycoprotein pherophorin-V34 [Volvox carteri f. nagariensis]EFJ41599.1 extracellular matrix glycoprotein pherophorin-V34 [Volvox carteri f. nagariensis]|eukprot:XP_002957390.1 extracellular matrix glycoprotein pherophorin-V34 [Volvox carteri f. nagariensis]
MAADGPRLRKGFITFGVAVLIAAASISGVSSNPEEHSLAHRRRRGLQDAFSDIQAIVADDNTIYSDSAYVQRIAGAEATRFPFCKCKTYACECSPYTVSLSSVTKVTNPAATKYCFKAKYNGCPTPVQPCCQALSLNVEKIAFTTTSKCAKRNVSRVDVRGRMWSSWETKSWPQVTTVTPFTEPCQWCATIRGTDVSSPVAFSKSVCEYVTSRMRANITAGFAAVGATVTFNGTTCDNTQTSFSVCGSSSPKEAVMSQVLADSFIYEWLLNIAQQPSGVCPPGTLQTSVTATVTASFGTCFAESCPVCARVTIYPPPEATVGPLNFGTNISCSVAAAQMINVLDSEAVVANALLKDFQLTACGKLYVEVCGNVSNAGSLNNTVRELALKLVNVVIFNRSAVAYNCPAGQYRNYNFSATIAPVNASAETDPKCISGFTQMQCSDRLQPNAPAPRTPPRPPSKPLVPPSPPQPPRPPPAPQGVMTHKCDNGSTNVPYKLNNIEISKGKDVFGNPTIAMCTRISSQACVNSTNSCCGMSLAKVELLVNTACKDNVRKITINGKDLPPSWAFYNIFNGLKFTDLDTLIPRASGATLCWHVKQTTTCNTPSSFCYLGRCQVNQFSPNNKCCPINFI